MAEPAARRSYRDFTIGLTPFHGESDPTRFAISLYDTPDQKQGTAEPFHLPFSTDLLGRRLRDVERDIRSPWSSETATPRELGQKLFDSLLTGPARQSLSLALDRTAGDPASGLRIRLLIDPRRPGGRVLSALPWELLYRSETNDSLGRSTLTPIVRQLPVPQMRNLSPLDGPLRVAVVVAAPRDQQPLALAQERERIEQICRSNPNMEIEIVSSGTHDDLRRALRSGRFHGFHFMGHGEIDPSTGAGVLVFEDRDGRSDPVKGESLAETIRDCPEVRFAVLNACDSGHLPRKDGQDPYTGVGTALMMAGLPAVVAMQFPISDAAALVFSESFYEALAEAAPIESAVTEGRKAMHRHFEESTEWATPALYLAEGGGEIVPRSRTDSEPPAPATPEPGPTSETSPKFQTEIQNGRGIVLGDDNKFGDWNF